MPDPIDVHLVGVGGVGRAFARRLAGHDGPVRLVGATDTSGTVLDPTGLDAGALVDAKDATGRVAGLAEARARGWSALEAARRVPADVLVQLTPTRLDDPGASADVIEAALASGKHVVTAAKDALACQPRRLRRAQRRHGRAVLASGAVGASVPVLETIERAFKGDTVHRVEALLNGSTTYVLSSMEDGTPRERALARARAEGLLEADPSVDLSGRDAAAKAALLHQRLYGSTLALDEVDVDGIGRVDEAACRTAARQGFAIRLLARVDRSGARVGPVEVPQEGPFAIAGPSCCVRWVMEGAGEVTLSGPGAGPRETASAVLSDVLSSSAATVPRVQAAALRSQQSSGSSS